MKFYLYSHNVAMIHQLVEAYPKLREVFIHMLVKEREKCREHGQAAKQEAINKIFQDYKDFPPRKKKDPIFAALNAYVFTEERLEFDGMEALVLHFEKEEKLRTHIKDYWGKKNFMV